MTAGNPRKSKRPAMARDAGIRTEKVRIDVRGAPMEQEVKRRESPFSKRRFGGRSLEKQHEAAAARLLRDMEIGEHIKSPSLEMGVDCSGTGAHDTHLKRVEAQGRVREVVRAIGRRNWEIVCLVLFGNANGLRVQAAVGGRNDEVSRDIRLAFDELVRAYGGRTRSGWTVKYRARLLEEAQRSPSEPIAGIMERMLAFGRE